VVVLVEVSARRRDHRHERDSPTAAIQQINASGGGVAQGAIGGDIINHPGPTR